MAKFTITVRNQNGELSVAADTIKDLVAGMEEAGISSQMLESIVARPAGQARRLPRSETTKPVSEPLLGIVELDAQETPHLTVPLTRLNAREIIGLLLFSKDPSPLPLGELDRIVSLNWKNVGVHYLSAVLSQIKLYVIKEGEKGAYTYRLSGAGRNWVLDQVLSKLREHSEQKDRR